MKFSIKDFFSKCDQIRSSLRIWSHLLKKFIMENFIFCAVWKLISSFCFRMNTLWVICMCWLTFVMKSILQRGNSNHEESPEGVLWKKVFLKISQLYKKETPIQVFSCEFCETFKNNFIYRTPLMAALVLSFFIMFALIFFLFPFN